MRGRKKYKNDSILNWNKEFYIKLKTSISAVLDRFHDTRCQFDQHSTYSFYARIKKRSIKRYWQLDCVRTLCGATGLKAAHKYVEIDPRTVASPWHERWLPRAPVSWSAKIDKSWTKNDLNLNSQKTKMLLLF